MKRDESTLKTKKALAESLKKYMAIKPLKKITISEIIADCDINRKTFYYHFEDIYALLKWMLDQEAIEVVKNFDLLIDYNDAITFIIDYIESNAHILNCAYDSLGNEELRRFLGDDFLEITDGLINAIEKELGVHVTDDFKAFLSQLYSEAFASMLVDWFKKRGNGNRSREDTIKYITLIVQYSLPEVLNHAPKK